MSNVKPKPVTNLKVAAPIKLWHSAGLNGLIYLVVLTYIALLVHSRVEMFATDELSEFLADINVSASSIASANTIVSIILWIPIIPAILTAILVPVRMVWIYGRVPLPVALSHTINALKMSFVMVYIALRRLGFVLIPVIAMAFMYINMLSHEQNQHFLNIYLAVSVLIGIPILLKGTPIFCAVPMAIVTHCPPIVAIEQSQFVIEGRITLLALIIALIGIFSGASLQAYNEFANGSFQQVASMTIGAVATIYSLTGLSLICVKSMMDYSKKVVKAA